MPEKDKVPEKYEHLLEEENYKGVLEEGLDKRTCRGFGSSREWVMSKTWDLLKNKGYDTFERAMEKAWDLLDKKCKKLGVPEGEVGGEFSKPKSKKEFEIQVSSSEKPKSSSKDPIGEKWQVRGIERGKGTVEESNQSTLEKAKSVAESFEDKYDKVVIWKLEKKETETGRRRWVHADTIIVKEMKEVPKWGKLEAEAVEKPKPKQKTLTGKKPKPEEKTEKKEKKTETGTVFKGQQKMEKYAEKQKKLEKYKDILEKVGG